MARKSVATPEGVIRYFMTASQDAALTTFTVIKTILDSRGLIAKRTAKPKPAPAGFVAGGQA
jgi:hypothetical protein